jgi:hypothetical protein
VAYDCKTATITMKAGATLSQEDVSAALSKSGFRMTNFRQGSPETQEVHLFRVTGMAPEKHAEVCRVLRASLSGATDVVVDSTGRAAVVTAKRESATADSLERVLAREGCGLEGLERKVWPRIGAVYEVTVPAMRGATASEEVRNIVSRQEKVVAAFVFENTKTVQLHLKEPCDRIEEAVRAALREKGYQVERFERT